MAREQLHDRLLPVVVGLHRSDKLAGVEYVWSL
jgi:hypothetical protein